MKTVWRDILLLSLALFALAEGADKLCSSPVKYPLTTLDKKFTSRQKFSSGDKVFYNCADDFTPSRGSRAVQCQDGKWTKLTLKCEKKSCGNAGELLNGHFEYEGNAFIGEKVYAICDKGYSLKGPNYMICKNSGWTGEFPTCEDGETTCSTPAVANSVQRGDDASVYRMGDNVNFTCSQGFQLDGAQQVTCGPGGHWQPQLPRCVPSPDKTQQSSGKDAGGCGVPQTNSNSNANLADRYIKMTSFPSGHKVYYVCDVGYTAAGGSRFRWCNNGKWTPLRLKCERSLCGSAGEILHGGFVYSGVEFGDTATAVCDEGYSLVGRATRHCMSKGWDGRVAVCEAVECAEPPEVTNAEMRGFQEPPYSYRYVLSYQCRVGTLIGQKEIWCTKNGTWSAPPPKCKDITCPPPNVPNAYWMGAHKQVHQHQDTISIECNLGYAMSGPSSITCNGDGRWYPALPKCRRTSRRTYWRS